MAKKSAGILLYRYVDKDLQVFLVHPGGPYFRNKDQGAWTIPKGEMEDSESPQGAAVREFEEETGMKLTGPFIPLTPVTQKGGKLVHAWAMEGNIDPAAIKCNYFQIEWPPRSGKSASFPEIDKGEWFTIPVASEKIIAVQSALITELVNKLTAKDNND